MLECPKAIKHTYGSANLRDLASKQKPRLGSFLPACQHCQTGRMEYVQHQNARPNACKPVLPVVHKPKVLYSMTATLRLTDVVCSDLQCLLLSVKEPNPLVLLVLQEPHLAHAPLLPFPSIVIKAVQFGLAAAAPFASISGLLEVCTRFLSTEEPLKDAGS